MLLRHILTSVQVALVVACGYMAYGVVVALVGAEELPSYTPPAPLDRPTVEHRLDAYESIWQRNLFKTPDKPLALTGLDPNEDLPDTDLKLRVIGTAATDLQQFAMAVLEDETTKQRRSLRIGDVLGDAELVRVDRRRVVIKNHKKNGEREQIAMEELKSSPTEKPPRVSPRRRNRSAAQRPSARKRTPRRGRLASRVKEMADRAQDSSSAPIQPEDLPADLPRQVTTLLDQAKFAPTFDETGELQGITVSEVKPGSQLDAAGLSNGDRILTVNGVEIEGPADLPKILPTLGGGTPTCIEFEGADGERKSHCLEN